MKMYHETEKPGNKDVHEKWKRGGVKMKKEFTWGWSCM